MLWLENTRKMGIGAFFLDQKAPKRRNTKGPRAFMF